METMIIDVRANSNTKCTGIWYDQEGNLWGVSIWAPLLYGGTGWFKVHHAGGWKTVNDIPVPHVGWTRVKPSAANGKIEVPLTLSVNA